MTKIENFDSELYIMVTFEHWFTGYKENFIKNYNYALSK